MEADHNEAWSLAHLLRERDAEKSNLARCYIELRELATKADAGPMNVVDTKRLHAIVTANDT